MSFTRAELKEMLALQRVAFRTDLDVVHAELQKHDALLANDRPRRRLFELFRSDRWQASGDDSKTLSLEFYSSPRRLTGTSSVSGLWLERNRPVGGACLSADELKDARVEGSGVLEHRPYQLVVSSTGFENHCSFGLPTRGPHGPICNADGRVAGSQKLFVTGWAATGATGDLSLTMRHAHAVADLVYHFLNDPAPEG